jgi:L-lactate utilization protein LutC
VTTRDAFLDRLRTALATAPDPVRATPQRPPERPPAPPVRYADGGGWAAAWTRLGGVVHHAADAHGVAAVVAEVADGRTVAAGPGALLTEVRADVRWPDSGTSALTDVGVGVAQVRCAVASTGSLVLDTDHLGGRALTLLPPVCVFVVRAGDVVPTPGDVLRDRTRWWPGRLPSQVLFVTGPSRSADIEMTLTIGVHGPGEVHAVLVAGAPESP